MTMMEWLLKGAILWLSIDLVVVSTLWYLSLTIRQLWPDWWRKVIVDTIKPDFADELYDYSCEVGGVALYPVELRSDNRTYRVEL
jgi:hypothetical protein